MKDRTCSIAAGQGGGAERKWLQKPKFATERRKRGEEKRGRGSRRSLIKRAERRRAEASEALIITSHAGH
jgi:hypothetical protein